MARDPAVGLAGDGVEIDHEDRHALDAGGLHDGRGDKAAEGRDDDGAVGAGGADDLAASADGTAPGSDEAERGTRAQAEGLGGDRDKVRGVAAEVCEVTGDASLAEDLDIEGARGAEEARRARGAEAKQFLGGRDGGEDVAAGAATGEEDGEAVGRTLMMGLRRLQRGTR